MLSFFLCLWISGLINLALDYRSLFPPLICCCKSCSSLGKKQAQNVCLILWIPKVKLTSVIYSFGQCKFCILTAVLNQGGSYKCFHRTSS